MKETFERVTERRGKVEIPVKHFYRRQYQTAGGNWSTIYYARFKDWKGKQRTLSLGSDLKTAREALAIYDARNIRREDFDLDRQKPEPPPERLTVARYIPKFLATKQSLPSHGFWKSCAAHLVRLLGSIPLDEPHPYEDC